MIRSQAIRCLLYIGLFLTMLGGLAGGQVALAAPESGSGSFSLLPSQETPPPDKIELSCKYPVLRGVAGHVFEFLVEPEYLGTKDRVFEVIWDEPPNWEVSMTGKYEEEDIESFTMKVFEPVPPEFKVSFGPVAGYTPEPGEYPLTLTVVSDDVSTTIELKAVVTARYAFEVLSATGRLSAEVTAGEENHLSILVVNRSSVAIEDIAFISSKPEGWSITYNPDRVESLGAGLAQEVDVIITPPDKTIAGDYLISLTTEANPELFDTLEFRLTVLTPTIWEWVGVIIVIVVIAGLAVLFRRLGRR
jgi:uncharacterized membrane protein